MRCPECGKRLEVAERDGRRVVLEHTCDVRRDAKQETPKPCTADGDMRYG